MKNKKEKQHKKIEMPGVHPVMKTALKPYLGELHKSNLGHYEKYGEFAEEAFLFDKHRGE